MIPKFTKSKFGQIVTVAFLTATATAGAMAWFYEHIRVPTLAERLSSKADRINDLEENLKKESLVSAGWKTVADQATNEVGDLSRKLASSRADYALLVERERISALQSATNTNFLLSSNAQGQRFAINLRQTVLSVGDQEDLGFHAVDKLISLLESGSSEHWRAEMDEFEMQKLPKKMTLQAATDWGYGFGRIIGAYTSFRIRMGELRSFVTKRAHEHYRAELSEADRIAPDVFYERIRNAPEIMRSLIKLEVTLLENTNSIGWNSNAVVAVESFMATNSVPTAKK